MKSANRRIRAGHGWLGVCIVMIFRLLTMSVDGGPWTHSRGRGHVEMYAQYWRNDSDFDADGKRVRKEKDGEYDEWRLETKLEYGLLPGLNLLAAAPWKTVRYTDNTGYDEGDSGVADLYVGAKARMFPAPEWMGGLWRGLFGGWAGGDDKETGWVVSIQSGIRIPAGYDENLSPALGHGEIEIESLLLAGIAFGERDKLGSGYVSAQVGHLHRGGELSDALIYGLDLGLDTEVVSGLRLKTTVGGIAGTGSGDNRQDYLNGTIGFVKDFGDVESFSQRGRGWTSEIGTGRTLTGKNSGAGTIGFFKLAYHF